MRWQSAGGTLVSAAAFEITRPGYYTNASNVFVADGEQRYRGIELATQGRLTRQLAWQTSAQWLDPRFQRIGPPVRRQAAKNASKHTGSAFLSYDLDALPGLSVNGGADYTGRRPVNDLDQAWLGGVTLFSLGTRYATQILGKRTTWQLNIDNVADKRYWAGGGGRLAAGTPRAIKGTFKVDL